MTLQKLNIQPKVDNAAKKQMVTSNVIGSSETLQANEVNAIVNKVNEVVDAYNFGSPITAFNFKENVQTYGDLPIVGNEVNDGYGVIADGLVYVWNGTTFPHNGDGFDLGLKPDENSKVEKGNIFAVSGDKVYDNLYIGETKEFPADTMTTIFNTVATAGYIYYDSRFLVTEKSLLKAVNIKFRLPAQVGNVDLVAISMTGAILHSETKSFTALVNKTNFTDLSTVNEPFFVGFRINIVPDGQPKNGLVAITTVGQEGYSYWKPIASGSFTYVAYKLGYSIDLSDGGIDGKIKSFYILTKSDTTKIQRSLDTSKKVVFDSNSVTIEDTIQVPNGANLLGVHGGTIVNFANGTAFNVEGKEDVLINGLKIKGSQPNYAYSMNGINSGVNIINNSSEAISNLYKGSEIALKLKSSENIILENIQFYNVNGVCLDVDRVGRDYIKGLKASKLFFNNSYKAIETKNEHEYSNYTDIMISLCQMGFDIDSGNLNVSNPIITRCRYGMVIRGSGFNNAHGIINGAELKHHQLAGLLIDNTIYGQYFNGLMVQYANIEINNAEKIVIPDLYFSHGTIKCTNTDKVGKNLITNLYNAGNTTLNIAGSNLGITNNYNLTTGL